MCLIAKKKQKNLHDQRHSAIYNDNMNVIVTLLSLPVCKPPVSTVIQKN